MSTPNAIAAVSSSAITGVFASGQTNLKNRYLNTLGEAVEASDLSRAKAALNAVANNLASYTTASNASTAEVVGTIAVDFRKISKALDAKDIQGTKDAWAKLKKDLAAAGLSTDQKPASTSVNILNNLAKNSTNSLSQTLFGVTSQSNSLNDLIGANAVSHKSSDVGTTMTNWLLGGANAATGVDSAVSTWLSYNASGSSQTLVPAATTGTILNAAA